MSVSLKGVSLPYSISKGSVLERYRKAQGLLFEFYYKVSPKFDRNRGVNALELQNDLRSVVPGNNICSRLFRVKNVVGPTTETVYNDSFVPIRHEIIIKGSPKQNLIKKDMNSLFHEAWHFFELIYNPKYIIRSRNFDNMTYNNLFSYYNKFIYNNTGYNEQLLRNNLNKLTANKRPLQKINILQELRYQIISEINAFSNAEKLVSDGDYYLDFKFKEKLDFIVRELKAVFKEARKSDPSTY